MTKIHKIDFLNLKIKNANGNFGKTHKVHKDKE